MLSEFEPARRLRGIQKSVIRQVFDRARPGSINLGLGEPDLPTPEVVRREAARVVTEEQNGYTSHAGLPALRERVAADYAHLRLAPEQVVVTAGSQEALYVALMTLVDEGDEVLIPDPGFVAYPPIVRMAGGTPKLLPHARRPRLRLRRGGVPPPAHAADEGRGLHQSLEPDGAGALARRAGGDGPARSKARASTS